MGGTDYAWWDMSLCNTDMDRFFASVDELAYTTGSSSDGERTAATISTGGTQVRLDDKNQKLDQLHFFMTANSRAPELNLFNRPRVTIWPFNQELVNGSTAGANSITPEDKLIQFASELGGVNSDGSFDYTKRKRFYFQRESAWDPDADWKDIADNRALFYYLQSMTAREIPSANPQRSGAGNSFLSKYGTANRNQIVTSIWDYIRSQVNTINLAYQPVGLTAYSFPQNHNNTTQAGFTDIAPLRIQVANTKGTGRFPVLTEVILQFVNLGEAFEDATQSTVIRKMRMVLLPVFQMPVNNLYGSLPRFQIKITGASEFQLTPNAPALARNPQVTGGNVWQLPGTAVSMGFPTAGGSGFRDPTCYVDAVSSSGVTRSGNMGFTFPMTAPVSTDPAVGIGGANTDNKLKVLSNRTPTAGADDLSWANTWGSREDVYYPFVSDVIEMRLPQKTGAASSDPPTPAVPTPAYPAGKDYFTATFSGGTIDITIYPGLTDAATAVSPISGNWQPQSPGNYLMHTSITFGPTTIPLPRLGPALTFLNPWDPLPHLTYADMKNYYARFADDRLMNVPRTNDYVPAMDVFRSYSLSGTAPLFGDLRVAALTRDIPPAWWQPSPLYNTLNAFYGMSFFPGDLKQWGGNPNADPADGDIDYLVPVTGAPKKYAWYEVIPETGRLHASLSSYGGGGRTVAPNTQSAPRNGSALGDFSNGFANASIGALIVGPDIGAVTLSGIAPSDNSPYYDWSMSRGGTDSSINTDAWHRNFTGAMFSPYKQIPSPVIFGGLSSRAATPEAWETLLFCPNPAGGKDTHRGWSQAPRDHFLLDLFYMPVVEPYAITENFSTAGKINLNYQIAPFSYIKRQTGIYALLDGMTSNWAHPLSPDLPGSAQGSSLVTVPLSEANASPDTFRSLNSSLNAASSQSFRKFVDTKETLKGFENRFSANDPFVSESEICEMFLVPQGSTIDNVEDFWKGYLLTGDDKREMPYNHIYPRVTTRSNTFRVHFWVQTLSPKLSGGSPIVTGEYRGSTIVERYLDVNLTDYGTPIGNVTGADPNAFPALSSSYRFRKIDHHQFAP